MRASRFPALSSLRSIVFRAAIVIGQSVWQLVKIIATTAGRPARSASASFSPLSVVHLDGRFRIESAAIAAAAWGGSARQVGSNGVAAARITARAVMRRMCISNLLDASETEVTDRGLGR